MELEEDKKLKLPWGDGSWFSTYHQNNNTKALTYEDFLHNVKKKVFKHFGLKSKETCIRSENWYLKDFYMCLKKESYDNAATLYNKSDNHLHPLLSLHGTQNMSKVNSIIKNGYILPGQCHPTLG